MGSIPLIGEAFAVFAAFCYAFGSVAITLHSRETGGGGNAVLLSIAITALLSGGMWLWLGPSLPRATPEVWEAIRYFCLAGLLATVMGRLFFFRAVEMAGAIETSLLRRLIPVFATSLAVVFLNERITPWVALAFAFVFSGVGLLFLRSPRKPEADSPQRAAHQAKTMGRGLALVSAGSYGGAYVCRKFGMTSLPDPLMGTFIGAVTGLLWFFAAAPVSRTYRDHVWALFRRPSLWQTAAAVAISVGQIAQFFALRFATVTAVAIISSIEVFLATWLASVILKTEPWPGTVFILASILAMAGVMVLAVSGAGT